MSADESSVFSDSLRLRLCGLLVENDRILLVQMHSPVTSSLIWTPPGGGLQFGERMVDGLKREFKQETNLEIKVQALVHINELVAPPFHTVEFYFEVHKMGGNLQVGSDPELAWDQQLIKDIKWMPLNQLEEIEFAPQSLLPKLSDWEHRSGFNPLMSG